MQADNARLLGVKEVAVILGRTEKAIRRRFEKGKMPPPVRLDSRLQWTLGDIMELIRAGKDEFSNAN